MKKKLRIAVFVGGPSAEHEVSLKTGAMILEHLDPERYEVRRVFINKRGRWSVPLKKLKGLIDVAFIAIHGEYGEDGTLQALLEEAHIPFTGSGSTASRLGMDKIVAGELFTKAGLTMPPVPTKFPVVVKPSDRGSSVGVTIAKNTGELLPAIQNALHTSPRVMFQQYIVGREVTCGVLEINGRAVTLPPTEIIPVASSFFDFKAKYAPGGSREITPPNLPNDTIKRIQRVALTAHRAIGCRGMSRTDTILDARGNIFVLEINTIPGMTKTSLLPQAAAAAGISFPKLLDYIIASALR